MVGLFESISSSESSLPVNYLLSLIISATHWRWQLGVAALPSALFLALLYAIRAAHAGSSPRTAPMKLSTSST
jgi:hypothetical protein